MPAYNSFKYHLSTIAYSCCLTITAFAYTYANIGTYMNRASRSRYRSNWNIIPLFDPKKEEKIEKKQQRVELFTIGEGSAHGNWLPQDACGGHKWNAAINKWVIIMTNSMKNFLISGLVDDYRIKVNIFAMSSTTAIRFFSKNIITPKTFMS